MPIKHVPKSLANINDFNHDLDCIFFILADDTFVS